MNNNTLIKATGEIFIIPNSAALIKDFLPYAHEKLTKRSNALCESVGRNFNANEDKLVEVWISSDELHTENLCRHGGTIEVDGKRYFLEYPQITENIPASLLQAKEGESIKLVYSNISAINNDDEEIKIDLELSLTCAQTKYRYRRFGNFEDVLKAVCA